MTREKMKSVIEGMLVLLNNERESPMYDDDAGSYAAVITDRLLQASQPQWYKPEEKLPEDREPRICLMRSLEITHKRYYKITWLNPSKTEFYVTYDDDGNAPIEKVVCWTDIPAFPQ